MGQGFDANDAADAQTLAGEIPFQGDDSFEVALLAERVLQTVSEPNWFNRLYVLHLGNVAGSSVFADQRAQLFPNQIESRPAEKPRTGFINAGDAPVHIARVNNVRREFDDVAITTLYALALNQARDLDQELFVTKRNLDVVISAGRKSFEVRRIFLAHSAGQQYRSRRRERIFLQPPA